MSPCIVLSVALSLCNAIKELEAVEPAKAQRVIWVKKAGHSTFTLARPAPQAKQHKVAPHLWPELWFADGLEVGTSGVLMVKYRVVSIVDGKNLLIDGGRTYLWLKGFSTKGLVDDDNVGIPWLVNVTGTTKYTTALGARSTVLVIEPLLETDEQRQAKERVAEEKHGAKLDRKAAAEKPLWRVWTDAARTRTVEAQFKGLVGGQVKLLKKDGTKISIPLEGLSGDDQAWIRDRKKQ